MLALFWRLSLPKPRTPMSRDSQIALQAVDYVRNHYSEDIFPPRPKGPHTEVYDGEAAAVARLTCDNIRREILERLAEVASEFPLPEDTP